jgi:hypothetical protein
MQVQHESDPSSALVTFTYPNEATAAMNCSEAVLGNRFIKMFYNNQQQERTAIKDRLGEAVASDTVVTMDGNTITKTIVNLDAPAPKEGEADPDITAAKENEKAAVRHTYSIFALQRILKLSFYRPLLPSRGTKKFWRLRPG